jgi:hypothetical protein
MRACPCQRSPPGAVCGPWELTAVWLDLPHPPPTTHHTHTTKDTHHRHTHTTHIPQTYPPLHPPCCSTAAGRLPCSRGRSLQCRHPQQRDPRPLPVGGVRGREAGHVPHARLPPEAGIQGRARPNCLRPGALRGRGAAAVLSRGGGGRPLGPHCIPGGGCVWWPEGRRSVPGTRARAWGAVGLRSPG